MDYIKSPLSYIEFSRWAEDPHDEVYSSQVSKGERDIPLGEGIHRNAQNIAPKEIACLMPVI
jgi:hypothetical protein